MAVYSDTLDTGNGTELSFLSYYRATSDAGNAEDSSLIVGYLVHVGTDVATASDSSDADIFPVTVDVAIASDVETSRATTSAATTSAGVGAEVAGLSLVVASASDGAVGDDSTLLLAIVGFSDSATGNDLVAVRLVVSASDVAYASDGAASSADLFVDTLDFGYGFDLHGIAGVAGTAYTVNSDSGAVGMYALPVRVAGVAELGGTLYFASESGLYAMDAETDLGAAIAWRIKTGMSAFGQERLKRLRDLNILGRTSGAVHLRVITARNGEKRSDTFIKTFPSSSSQRGGVIKVGRGLSSVYWGLEIEGRASAEIDTLSLSFDPLTRRY